VLEVKNREFRVGLAANVAQNIHSLGGVGILVGLVGDDAAAKDLGQLLKANGVSEQNLVVSPNRPTTRKVRVMSGQHHIVRVDYEERQFLSPSLEAEFLERTKKLLAGNIDGVILQDYGKGVLSETLIQKIIQAARAANKKIIVDPHRTTPVRYYRGADLIKPNRDEAFVLSGLNIDDLHLKANSLDEVAAAIQKQTACANLIITQGSKGVTFYQGSRATVIPTESRQVFDVTGAGDTYLATFSLAWLSGWDPLVAAVLANAASGVVVGKIGSVPCTKAELLEALG